MRLMCTVQTIALILISLLCFNAFGDLYVQNPFVVGTIAQQTVHVTPQPNDGVFYLGYTADGVLRGSVGPISYDATNAQVQTKLRLIPGLGSVTVAGAISTDYTVTFTGVNGPVTALSEAGNTLGVSGTEVLHFSSNPGTSGDYTLSYGASTTPSIAASADSTTLQTRLRTISALSAVTASGAASTDFTVTFKGVQGVPSLLTVATNTTGKSLSVSRGVSGDTSAITIATSVPGVATKRPTTTSWVQLVPSMSFGLNHISANNTSTSTLLLGTGASGDETGKVLIFPSMAFQYDVVIEEGDRVVLTTVSGDPTAGYLDINFQKAN